MRSRQRRHMPHAVLRGQEAAREAGAVRQAQPDLDHTLAASLWLLACRAGEEGRDR